MNITRDTVLYIARLARLRLTEAEVPRMQRDLDAILGYVRLAAQLDTTGVPPTTHVLDIADAAAARRDRAACCPWPRWCATRRSTTESAMIVPKVLE